MTNRFGFDLIGSSKEKLTKMKTNYQVKRTKFGWEVWDGIAFENPPLAFPTSKEAQKEANRLNYPRTVRDETVGSTMTGREWI